MARGLVTTAQAQALADGLVNLHQDGEVPTPFLAVVGPILDATDPEVGTAFWARVTERLSGEALDSLMNLIGGGSREKINPVTLRFDAALLSRLRVYQAAHASSLSEAVRDAVRAGLESLGY